MIFFSLDPHWLFKNMLFSFCPFLNFPFVLLLLISSFFPLCLESILWNLSIFLNLLRLFCDLIYSLSWRTLHVHLSEMCILLLLGRIPIYVRSRWFIVLLLLLLLYFLIDLLFRCSTHYSKWSSEVSNYYFRLSISPFFSVTVCH